MVKHSKKRSFALVGTAAALVVAVAACGSSSKSSQATTATTGAAGGTIAGSSTTTAGSSGTTAPSNQPPITVGMIVDLTGPGASTYSLAVKGVQARLNVQNAEGGVDGRQLKLVTADDAGSPTQAATAANALISQHNPLVVIADSDVTFGAANALHQAGEPVFGDGEDGGEWGQQPYTNMFALPGDYNATTDNDDTTYEAQFLKNLGATNAASVGYGAFPSAVGAVKYFAGAAKTLGMKVGYENTTIPASGMNATAIALAMKTANVDTMFMALQTSDALNLLVALKQEGLKLKVPYITTGYGQDFLNQSAAVQAGQGAYFLAFQRPIEEHTPATIAEEAALNKAGWAGDPSINVTFGWLNADLAIAGLEAAGPNPTKAEVISAVRNKVTNWNGGGLVAVTRDYSLAHFGQSPQQQCGYFVQLKGTTYIPVPASGAPTCGVKTGNAAKA